MSGGLRDLQRTETETAMLEAAWQRYASIGPDGTSVREVAADAGCTHALVARYFGSKDGLIDAVAQRLTAATAATADAALASGNDPIVEVLTTARRSRSCVRLLVRSGLGDLGESDCPAAWQAARILTPGSTVATGARAAERGRLCTYGAASLILGWLTYETFVTTAVRLGAVSGRRRDLAMAAAARRVLEVASSPRPNLTEPLQVDRTRTAPSEPTRRSAADLLVDAAVELFAAHGPASVSVRDVARLAQVNQGLIYRHIGSKDALIAAAFERGSSDLFPAALAPEGFDIDTVIHQVHHGSRAPRLIARIVVDDVDVTTVRKQFPILRRLLSGYPQVPRRGEGADVRDPRVVVAAVTCMAMGSAIYGRDLRRALDLEDEAATEAAIAALCRVLLAEPVT